MGETKGSYAYVEACSLCSLSVTEHDSIPVEGFGIVCRDCLHRVLTVSLKLQEAMKAEKAASEVREEWTESLEFAFKRYEGGNNKCQT